MTGVDPARPPTLTRRECKILRGLLAPYETDSLSALLWAASSSPAARQRRTVITVLLALALRSQSIGGRAATHADLPGLVDAALGKVPWLRHADDWVPPDPALDVRVGYLDRPPIRIHPGDLEQPLDVLPTAFGYAYALDEMTMALLQFSCTDLIAVTVALLRHHDEVLGELYRAAPNVTIDTPPSIEETDFDATREYLAAFDLTDLAGSALECHADPDTTSAAQIRRAIDWATADAGRVPLRCTWPISVLGPSLLLRTRQAVLPVPAAHLLSGLIELLGEFCYTLGQDAGGQKFGPDWPQLWERAEARWAEFAELQLRRAVTASGAQAVYPACLPEDSRKHALLITGHRHVLLVALCPGLSPGTVAAGVEDARHRLAALPDPVRLSIPSMDDMLGAEAVISEADGVTWVDGYATGLPFMLPADDQPVLLAPGTKITPIIAVVGAWAAPRFREASDPVLTVPLPELRQLFEDALYTFADSQEAWEFLENFAGLGGDEHGAGWETVYQFSLLDSWEVWKAQGVLSPAWVPENAVYQVAPADSVVHWNRAAEQSATDVLLAALDLPPVAAWNSVHRLHQDEDPATRRTGLSTSVLSHMESRTVAWAIPELDLVILADLQFSAPGLTREGLIAIADSLRQQLTSMSRCAEAWAPWQQAHKGPVLVVVNAVPTETGMFRIGGRPGRLEIGLLSPEEPVDAVELWHLLGQAVSDLLCRLMTPRPEEPVTADQPSDGPPTPEPLRHEHSDEPCEASLFASHWAELPPTLVSFEPSHVAGGPGAPATPLSDLRDRRARQRVIRGLRTQLEPGEHQLSVFLDRIGPHAMRVLDAHCSAFDQDALVLAAAAELERAFAERLLAQDLQVRMAEQGQSFDDLADVVEGNSDQVRRTRGLEFLTEFILAQGSNGTLRPDRRDVADLRDVATWMLTTALTTANSGAGLWPSVIDIDHWGSMGIRQTAPGPVDLGARAALLHLSPILRMAETSSEDQKPSPSPQAARAESDAEAAQYWLSLDLALIECWRTTLSALFATLAVVSEWDVPPEPHNPIAIVDTDDLITAVLERIAEHGAATAVGGPGQEREHVASAIDLLTLRGESIRDEGLSYWLLERRAHRLALRPLIHLNGKLVLLPRRAYATITLFRRYLSDSRVPWPDTVTPTPIRSLVAARRLELDKQLERETATICRQAGLQARPNIGKGRYPKAGIELPGQIDVLAVDENRGIIWVIECKHMYEPFSPPEMARQVAAMHGRQALIHPLIPVASKQTRYVDRLLAKAAIFAAQPAAAAWLVARERDTARADAQMATAQGQGWTIVPVMVSDHLQVAAFYHQPAVIWTEIDWLPHLLAAPEVPPPGPWLPDSLLQDRVTADSDSQLP